MIRAYVGSGGKTTLIKKTAEDCRRQGLRVLVTTSTHMRAEAEAILSCEAEEIIRALDEKGYAMAGCDLGEKMGPLPPQVYQAAYAHADMVLVEADGSRHLPLKAHLPHEPVIPPEAEQVICVVGASGLNRPVALAAHRPERFALLAGSELADPPAVARVLEREALHHRVFINQADSPGRIAAALALAKLLRCPVVVASLQKGEILCSY